MQNSCKEVNCTDPSPSVSIPCTGCRGRRLWSPIEIGLEYVPFIVLVYFFPSVEHAKNLLIMGPINTKNSLLKCDFLIFNFE